MIVPIDEALLTVDPDKIDLDDKIATKALFVSALNTLESFAQEIIRLREENQNLKNEIAYLKGEKGKPQIKPSVPTEESKAPKVKPKTWKKRSKKDRVKVDRTVEVPMEDPMPADAKFLGFRRVIIQDMKIQTDNVEYLLPRYYSPSQKKYYDAKLPKEVRGSEFGPHLKAWIAVLYFACRVTENKIHQFLNEIGISISEGQISNIITKEKHQELTSEKESIFAAGMRKASYVQTDDTSARHKGKNLNMHVVCNSHFTCYSILNSKKRDDIRTMFGLKDGEKLKIPLITDGAKQYIDIVIIHALCWIHEIRHYIKITPYFGYHKKILEAFMEELYGFYNLLLQFKFIANDAEEIDTTRVATLKAEILSKFDELFFHKHTDYVDLNRRLALTWENRDSLLKVLDYPFIPLHNNESEIAAREPVIKRKISYGTRSELGKAAWENMLSIKDTCRKTGVSFYKYMLDIYSNSFNLPRLAALI